MNDHFLRKRDQGGSDGPHVREPVFNLPLIVTITLGLAFAIHGLREWVLSDRDNVLVLAAFAFIPLRYGPQASELPLQMAAWWTPVTYSLLHGGWVHLAINSLWLAAFGSPVAKRIGSGRFLVLAVCCSLGGALAHLASHGTEMVPMIGASAVVSGLMGSAARFAFIPTQGGMLNVTGPALTLAESFANPRFLTFLLVWMVLNLMFGAGQVVLPGSNAAGIAWQAHIGGFLVGILAFSWLDPRPRP